jgi:Ca2+-binding RTX toxin-like protein
MRKTVLVLASMALAVLLASGVALAANIKGTEGDDELYGTTSRDTIIPFGGDDTVYALGSNDDVRHSFGNDTIYGGAGKDTLRGGRGSDVIYGGPGSDLIDCAWLETRVSDVADTAYYTPGEDTVVDCKTKITPDPTDT